MTVRRLCGLFALTAIAVYLPAQADEPVPMQRLTPSEIAALAPPPNSGTTAAVKVSFDRPQSDSGLGQFYKWELNFIRWMERSGYDATYTTNM